MDSSRNNASFGWTERGGPHQPTKRLIETEGWEGERAMENGAPQGPARPIRPGYSFNYSPPPKSMRPPPTSTSQSITVAPPCHPSEGGRPKTDGPLRENQPKGVFPPQADQGFPRQNRGNGFGRRQGRGGPGGRWGEGPRQPPAYRGGCAPTEKGGAVPSPRHMPYPFKRPYHQQPPRPFICGKTASEIKGRQDAPSGLRDHLSIGVLLFREIPGEKEELLLCRYRDSSHWFIPKVSIRGQLNRDEREMALDFLTDTTDFLPEEFEMDATPITSAYSYHNILKTVKAYPAILSKEDGGKRPPPPPTDKHEFRWYKSDAKQVQGNGPLRLLLDQFWGAGEKDGSMDD